MVRDWSGHVVLAFARKSLCPYVPLLAECLAIREGLLLAQHHRLSIREVESDCLVTVQVINKVYVSLLLDSIANDIRKLLSEHGDGSCHYISRQRNVAAHTIARESLAMSSDAIWTNECPSCIFQCITHDASL